MSKKRREILKEQCDILANIRKTAFPLCGIGIIAKEIETHIEMYKDSQEELAAEDNRVINTAKITTQNKSKKKRGRPSHTNPDKDVVLVDEWHEAKEVGISKAKFCNDKQINIHTLNNTLDRHRHRNLNREK